MCDHGFDVPRPCGFLFRGKKLFRYLRVLLKIFGISIATFFIVSFTLSTLLFLGNEIWSLSFYAFPIIATAIVAAIFLWPSIFDSNNFFISRRSAPQTAAKKRIGQGSESTFHKQILSIIKHPNWPTFLIKVDRATAIANTAV
jgi:hypothetical protein